MKLLLFIQRRGIYGGAIEQDRAKAKEQAAQDIGKPMRAAQQSPRRHKQGTDSTESIYDDSDLRR